MNAADAEAFASGNFTVATSPVKSAAGTSTTSPAQQDESTNVQDESGWDAVYCDGACKGNGQQRAIAGVGVWWGRNDPR